MEEAFRFDQQKKSKKGQAPQPPGRQGKQQQQQQQQTSSKGATPEKQTPTTTSPPSDAQPKSLEDETPEWLSTASEEIQTLVAQRHFEDAQSLIKRTQEFLRLAENTRKVLQASVIGEKMKQQEQQLTNVLIKELSNSHNRNLQIALRAARRPLRILVDMGRSRQASATLLKVCTVSLRVAQREARRNNAEISELFFRDLTQVACDFLRAFEQQPACVSGMFDIGWIYLHYILNILYSSSSTRRVVQRGATVLCQSADQTLSNQGYLLGDCGQVCGTCTQTGNEAHGDRLGYKLSFRGFITHNAGIAN